MKQTSCFSYGSQCSMLAMAIICFSFLTVKGSSDIVDPYPTASHYWPLYKTNYSIVYDTLAYAHGDVHGAKFVSVHRLGNVVSFGGERQWVDFEAGAFAQDCIGNPIFCTRGFSIAFWIRLRGGRSIFASGGLTNSSRGTGVRISYKPIRKSYHVEVVGHGKIWYVSAPAVLHSWCHVTVTWSNAEGLRFYLDGDMQKSDLGGRRFATETVSFSKIITLAKPVSLLDLRAFGNFDMAHLAIWYYELAFDQASYAGKRVLRDSLEATVGCFAKAVDPCYENPCDDPKCKNFEKAYKDTVCPDLGHTFCKVPEKPTRRPPTSAHEFHELFSKTTSPGSKIPAELRPGKNGGRTLPLMIGGPYPESSISGLCRGIDCDYHSVCKDARGIPYCACPEDCPKTRDPVCGSNGRTYLNACSLKVDSCKKKKIINITRHGPCGIPYQNAIHYWPMNNISSRGAMYDLRGRSQASAYNGIVSKTTNQLGRVSVFDGLDDWIRIKGFQEKCITDPSICENGLSIGFWLKMLGGDYIISGGHYGARPSGPGFRIFQDTDSKQYRVEVATRSDLWRVSLHALPTSWFHLLFTWNKQNGLQLYLNGRFAIQGSGPNKIDNLLKDIENDQVVVIGKPDTFVRLRSYGRFEIGHLVIWDYPLPAMEVKQAYKAMVQTNAKSTVCCYYRMSDKCSRYPCYRFQNPVLCSGVIENKKCICPDIPGPRKCDERIFAGKCADRRPDCSQLASQPGYCDHFQQEMETLCPAACNYCVPEPKLAGRNERRKLSREILIFSILGCVVGIILLFLISIYSWKVYRNRYTGSFIPPKKCASDPELVIDEFTDDKWTKKYIDPAGFQIKDVPPKKRALPIIPPRPPQPKYQPPEFD